MNYRIGKDNPAYKHGMHGTPAYKIWQGMILRCHNPKVKIYKYYGGRGIKVCKEWIQDFLNFYFDMGERPVGMQLDRINNDGDYCKENCRWATPKENNPYNKGDIKDEMPGRRFGKWLVIEKLPGYKRGHWYYLCKCDCGIEKIIAGGELRRGRTTQCKKCKHVAHKNWPERLKNVSI